MWSVYLSVCSDGLLMKNIYGYSHWLWNVVLFYQGKVLFCQDSVTPWGLYVVVIWLDAATTRLCMKYLYASLYEVFKCLDAVIRPYTKSSLVLMQLRIFVRSTYRQTSSIRRTKSKKLMLSREWRSEWSTILLSTKVRPVLEVCRYLLRRQSLGKWEMPMFPIRPSRTTGAPFTNN